MKITITNKKTISELYDILSTKLGFGVSLDLIESIVIGDNSLIILDNKNNWLGNFNCSNHISNYIESKLNK